MNLQQLVCQLLWFGLTYSFLEFSDLPDGALGWRLQRVHLQDLHLLQNLQGGSAVSQGAGGAQTLLGEEHG
jgi:hypothetical protein